MTSSAATAPVDQLVDWELAARTAARVVRPGPPISAEEAEVVVGRLREAARAAAGPVASVSGMSAPRGAGELVLDRPGWARANALGMRALLAPVVAESVERRGRPLPPAVAAVGSRVTGAEVGSLLGFLSSRVLGQYDAFADPPRLLLVAPNIVAVEQQLEVDPDDFRLWVCLHEETHRVQFGANPWLAEHLSGRVRALVADLLVDPGQVVDRLARVLRSLPETLRGEGGENGLLDVLSTPAQREALSRVTAVMSLLEGHADVVSDDVGTAVVGTVEEIRRRFNRRRTGQGGLDRLLRRLLGLEAKMRQYADGARFVRGVQEAVGVSGFNAVWTSPDTLPRPKEIAEPLAWVRRVHG